MRVFKLFFILLAGLQLVQADVNIKDLQRSAEFLTPKLLMKMFKGDDLNKAYALAQIEDFETNSTSIFTPTMTELMSESFESWEAKLKAEPGYLKIKNGNKGSKEKRLEFIQAWRYTFLTKLMDAVRYRNSLKPTLKFFVASETQYDSNVNKQPEQSNTGAPVSSSGKADWQQMFLLHADWEPLVNCRKFPKDLKLIQSFNLITISQADHKENEVFIFDTEPKLIKTFDSYFQKLSLAYRFQHFAFSGDQDSRDTHSLFQSHRVKLQMDTKMVPFWFDFVDSVQTGWYLSYDDKQHYVSADKTRDAQDTRIGLQTTFFYDDERLRALLEYSDYQTDNSVTTEYKYLRAKLTHYHSHKLSLLNQKINMSEEIGYRIKSWDDYDGADSNRDEDTYYIKAKVSTALTKKSDISLHIKYLSRERDEQFLGVEEADQTIVGLGLNWRTP